MAAALAAGSAGVRVGTRFVAAAEAEAHPAYLEKLVAAEAKDTVLTEAFSTGWPNAPHRVLRASVEAAERFQGEIVGERARPWAPDVRVPVPRFGALPLLKTTTGHIDAMCQFAGESVRRVNGVKPAAEIIRELAGAAEELLRTCNRAFVCERPKILSDRSVRIVQIGALPDPASEAAAQNRIAGRPGTGNAGDGFHVPHQTARSLS